MAGKENPKGKGAFSKTKNVNNMSTPKDPNNQYGAIMPPPVDVTEGANPQQPVQQQPAQPQAQAAQQPAQQAQPQQPVQQAQPQQPVQQAQPQQPVQQAQPQQPVQQAQQAQPPSQSQANSGTFFQGGNEVDGFIEIDLVSQRYKGEESRYLSIFVNGFSIDEQNNTVNSGAAINITNENEFNAFKVFVSKLSWND